MSEVLTLQVRNSDEAIAPATQQAESWLGKNHASADCGYFVSLAIEEVVTNCIKYGYDDAGERLISIILSIADQVLTMVVVDDGHEFNPLTVPPPNMSLEIEGRPIGGLGIHLLRELADSISYERCGNTNRLTLTKRIV